MKIMLHTAMRADARRMTFNANSFSQVHLTFKSDTKTSRANYILLTTSSTVVCQAISILHMVFGQISS